MELLQRKLLAINTLASLSPFLKSVALLQSVLTHVPPIKNSQIRQRRPILRSNRIISARLLAFTSPVFASCSVAAEVFVLLLGCATGGLSASVSRASPASILGSSGPGSFAVSKFSAVASLSGGCFCF